MLSQVEAIVEAAGPHGAMALAQAYKESSLGKDATAQRTRNPYGIMEFGDRPCERVFNGQLCLRKFPDWAAATKAFAAIIADADPPYHPEDISLEDYLATYVGGPGCRSSRGQGCANGETWVPGGTHTAGSINLYIWQTIDRLNQWMSGTTPADPPKPPKPVDPLSVILGGKPVNITQGWKNRTGPDLYRYGIGHGLDGREHTGIDIGGERGWTLHSPGAGVVVCDGTGVGPGSWGTGCAAFPDYDGGGAGRVEILLDSGVALILGHSATSPLQVGDRVRAGQGVATMGGMYGDHVHVETRVPGCQTYCIVDPVKALGGTTLPDYPPRVPFDPDSYWTVTAKAGAVVRQRADPDSPAVAEPFTEGETFEAKAIIMGTDGKPWYLGRFNGRVAVADTTEPKVRIG